MKLFTLLALSLLSFGCSVNSQQSATSSDNVTAENGLIQGFSKQRLSRVDEVMQQYIASDKLAGTVTLVARNNEIVHLSANGMKDRETGEKMTTDTLFRIYSMTKPITAVAALTLWEQGKFHMYDPIEKYLPELANLKVYVSGEGNNMVVEDAKNPVRIIDLFLHTAGFSYGFTGSEIDKLYRALPTPSETDTVESVLLRLAKIPLNHQPGTQWHYGVNTDIIGFLVERLSGKKLGDYMQEVIFDPLQMNDTGFYVPANKASRLAQIYGPDKNGATVVVENEALGNFLSDPPVHNGGGGLVSTIGDFYVFSQMLLNGGQYNGVRILGSRTVEYLSNNHLPPSMVPFKPDSPGEGYALAMSVTTDPSQVLMMSSQGDYGWGGAASTYFRIAPEENMIVISMTQFLPTGFHLYQHDFRNVVYQSLVD
jgi:CubicO group peptidase (beta-lactamase class C family)